MVYYFSECDAEHNLPNRRYQLVFKDLEDGIYKLQVYTLDDTHNNTYRLWQRMGSPAELSKLEQELLHAEQEITADAEQTVEVKGDAYRYAVELSSVSMKLVTLTRV